MKLKVKVLVPAGPLVDPVHAEEQFRRAIAQGLAFAQSRFERTTATWTHRPAFRKSGPRRTEGRIEGTVSTSDAPYFYVTRGTRRHAIVARRKRRLAFQTGYRAKTRPRVIGSWRGGPFGPVVYPTAVVHPGTEARDFDLVVAQETQEELAAQYGRAVTVVALRSRVGTRELG